MRVPISLAVLLLLASVAAQDPVAPKDPPRSEAKSPAAARLQALQEEANELFAAWRKQIEAARSEQKEGSAPAAMRMRPDFSALVPKFQAAANDYAGTDDAVPFLVWIAQTAEDKKVARGAFETLITSHVDSSALAEMGRMLPFLDRVFDKDLAKRAVEALAKSKDADVRGWAVLAQNQQTIEKAAIDGDAYKQARTLVLAAAEQATAKDLIAELKSSVDQREKFGVGNVAPDIEGEDLDGVAFKLSDYKGKVVFLDFWGDW
jgi:hypothetical protein